MGMLKVRVYLPVIAIWRRAVSGFRDSSTVSSLPVLRSSLRSSVMFMHIFWGWSHSYSSKMVLGHWKSIMATRLGSIARSWMSSGFRLKVASSTRIAMAWNMSRRSFALVILTLNNAD